MRRPFRILFNALTVLSVILFAATVVLWVRGYRIIEQVRWSRTSASRLVQSDAGAFICCAFYVEAQEKRPVTYRRQGDGGPHVFISTDGSYFVFGRSRSVITSTRRVMGFQSAVLPGSIYAYRVPCGAVALVVSLLPVGRLIVAVRRMHRRRRSAIGHCPTCGYDLRATPDRCPECGTVPDASKAPAAQPLARR